jgi:hypothetical protein
MVTTKKKVTTKLSDADREIIEGYIGLAVIGRLEDHGQPLKSQAWTDLVSLATRTKMPHLLDLLEGVRGLVNFGSAVEKNNKSELN